MNIIGANGLSSSEVSSKAREILERKIESGRASAIRLIEHVRDAAPIDTIAKGSEFLFRPTDAGVTIERASVGKALGIHKHALQQLASRAHVPGAYINDLVAGTPWQKELAADILNRHYHKGEDARMLVRSVKAGNGLEVRGVMSDRYRRLDSRPLVAAFCESIQSVGAVAVDGHVTDTRVALRALLPTVYEPIEGEALCLGIEWGNSDFGAARHTIRAFILRLWCLNGATMENALAQVHVGGKLGHDIALSQRTYELDTQASASALDDVIRGTIAPEKVEVLLAGIRSAHEKKIDWKNAKGSLAKKLLKGELDAVAQAYESKDNYNMPEGQTTWRLSNAISWIAGHTEDGDRKLELQRLAGEVVNGKRDREFAEAA